MNTVRISHPSLRVVMIGNGELREEVETAIKCDGLENTITLLGFQKNPYKYIKQANLLLMPSSWEGYGLAAVEALALGLPVVCSDAGGLPMIVNDTCGRVCKTKREYIDEITLLLDNEGYMAEKSAGARQRADELDNLVKYKDRILSIYDGILNISNDTRRRLLC